jgi:membrane fusion protein, multidrug efflux system
MSRVSMVRAAVLVVAIGLAAAACETRTTADAVKPGARPTVGVVLVRTQNVTLTMELPGRTSSCEVAEVRPQVSGLVTKRLFTEGTDVEAGEVLFHIDPATYQAAYSRAKAELARAEANITTLQLREQRYRELVEIKAISRQEFDDTRAALMQAEAEIQVAQAALETARINLGYTRVKAPISGRIGRSAVTTGALVTASQPAALATIHQLDPIYVDVTQSTTEVLELKRKLASGQLKNGGADAAKVRLLLEAGEPYAHQGTFSFSDVSVDQSTGSIVLRTVFPNPEQLLLPGMFVRAQVAEGVAEQTILVPQQGVGRNPKGEAVALVVDANGTVEQRKLTVDRALGDQWLVSSGLSPGDRLIVEGVQKVRPGAEVNVVLVEEHPGREGTAVQPSTGGGN